MLKSVKNINLQIPGLKVKRKIGEGGMSVVYLAEQLSLKREVAIKVLKLEVAGNEIDVQRFKQEAKTIAHLHHPNIIDIYDIGHTKNGEVYFTMPYLNHGNFSTYQMGDEKEFIHLLKSICDGLAFAHNRGIIHRDIKPDNLIFDPFGNVKIADFGIALSKKEERMTKEHQIVGSAQYMSPEQARSLKVDLHSDIYSLGIVIYERLTGSVPFDAEEGIAILVNHVSVPPPKLPARAKHWQKLIDKCLAKNPAKRFQSMHELKHALELIPVNPIQRTHREIYQALTNKYSFNKVWLALMVFASLLITFLTYYKNNPTVHPIEPITENTDKVKPAIISSKPVFSNTNTDNNSILNNTKSGINTLEQVSKQEIKAIQTTTNLPFHENTNKSIESENFVKLAFKNATASKLEIQLSETDYEIQRLLISALTNIKEYKLIRPGENNATNQLLKILILDPQNQQAQLGLQKIAKKYHQIIDKQIQIENYSKSLTHTNSLMQFLDKTQLDPNYIKQYKQLIINKIKSKNLTTNTLTRNDVGLLTSIVQLIDPKNELIDLFDSLDKKHQELETANNFLATQGLETINISSDLAFLKTEITKAQYKKFALATNRNASKCKHQGGSSKKFFGTKSWKKPHFDQASDHPVICVSWLDAKAYAQWISHQAGMKFRLPKKSEWLLVSTIQNTPFNACQTANVSAQEASKIRNKDDKYSCFDNYVFTAPVASFAANQQGLNDIQGNVSEWLLDCESNKCIKVSAIGSSWFDGINLNKINKHQYLKANTGHTHIGFRLVLEL